MTRGNRTGEEGYTLIEVLVAFAILVGAIVIGFQTFAQGLRQISTMEKRQQAIHVARAELDRLSLHEHLAEGIVRGTAGGVAWAIELTPIEQQATSDAAEPRPLRTVVTWQSEIDQGEPEILLETVLIAGERRP